MPPRHGEEHARRACVLEPWAADPRDAARVAIGARNRPGGANRRPGSAAGLGAERTLTLVLSLRRINHRPRGSARPEGMAMTFCAFSDIRRASFAPERTQRDDP